MIFLHKIYRIKATNESVISNSICVDNCPEYELPNVFSPNNDNVNDLFVPIKNKHITSVEMKIFNRWGHLLFESDNVEKYWDGFYEKSRVAQGVYYYAIEAIGEDYKTYNTNGSINVIH